MKNDIGYFRNRRNDRILTKFSPTVDVNWWTRFYLMFFLYIYYRPFGQVIISVKAVSGWHLSHVCVPMLLDKSQSQIEKKTPFST